MINFEYTDDVFNGQKIPRVPTETINSNNTDYRELDIVSSIFRGKILFFSTGATSDNMTHYLIRISGIGYADKRFGYYEDSRLIWGTCEIVKSIYSPTNPVELKNKFIGFVSGINGSVGARFHIKDCS